MARDHATCFAMLILNTAEFFQREQAKFTTKIIDTELLIVVVVFPFALHTAKPHTNPRGQFLEVPTAGRKARAEVLHRTSDRLVEFLDGFFSRL